MIEVDMTKWPDCKKPGCKNKCCLLLESEFCYPHSNRPQDLVAKQLDKIMKEDVKESV
jgi:hypothetical protein